MKHPLVPVSLVYAAGLVTGHFLEAPIVGAFVASAGVVIGALVIPGGRLWLLGVAVLLFGWLNLSLRTAVVSPHDLRSVVQGDGELATVRGVLCETPSQRVFVRDEKESWRSIAELRVQSIRLRHGEWRPAHGRVMTSTSGILEATCVEGQGIEVRGVMLRPALPVADGVFDHRRHLEARGIYHELKVGSPEDWKLHGAVVPVPLSQRFRTWAQPILARGLPQQDEALRLQWAMLLGWQTALTNEVSEPFMRSGTMHIFAISGLHIALIAGIFVVLLRAALVPRLLCGLFVIPLIWFYTAATGWQPSAVRSTVMMTVIICGWMLGRPGNLLNSLATAGCIILVCDPQQLFQASFQLSFFVVLSIALLVPRLDQLKERLFKLDPLLPLDLRPWWQRRAIRLGDVVWVCFATSLAAFLGSLPLVAFYFHLFTPGSLLANLVVVPASALALMSGLGALITGDFVPLFTDWFNHSGWFFMSAMMWLSERSTMLPAAWMHIREPGVLEFLCYYGLLLALLTRAFSRPVLRWIAAGALVALAAGIVAQWLHLRQFATVNVIPLNGAHAVVAREARASRDWLLGCGGESGFGLVLKPFLQARGVNRLGQLVLDEADTRHAGAAPEVAKLFPPVGILTSPVSSRSAPFRVLLSDLKRNFPVRTDATNGFRTGAWTVLHPAPGDRFARNQDGAVVMLAELNGVRVLMLPGLGRKGQEALFNRHPGLRADIVVAAIPDGEDPLADELIGLIQPRLIVLVDSEHPPTRRADAGLRERLRRSGVPVLCTRDAGGVTLRLRDGKWDVRGARTTERSGGSRF